MAFDQFRCTLDIRDLPHDGAPVDKVKATLAKSGVISMLADHGIAIIDGLAGVDQDRWPGLFESVCAALGRLLPQSMAPAGQLVREIRYQDGNLSSRTVRYSDSRNGGSYHTDGVGMPGPVPDTLALLCVRQAPEGGELVFLESSAVLGAALARMPSLIEVLGVPFHFDQRRADEPRATVVRHVVDASLGLPRLVYLRDYIESAHAMEGLPKLTAVQTAAMDVLDSVMDDEALHIEGRLEPGEIALSDNHRFLHGRHAFGEPADGEQSRLMLRYWIRSCDE